MVNNDDENSASADTDPVNSIDDDNDGSIDEDPSDDINGDSCPGICGGGDDGDGSVDEGLSDDDDEDGSSDEDWLDPVVFYLESGTLKERTPVPWDASGSGGADGRDFVVETIAENVTRFRVERLAQTTDRALQIDLILELTSPASGETISLHTQLRVGGAL